MHDYSWVAAPIATVSKPLVKVEAGINDVQLDRRAQDGTCPVVQLSKAEVKSQIRLVRSGLLGRGACVCVCA
jgi:hypothetical protein